MNNGHDAAAPGLIAGIRTYWRKEASAAAVTAPRDAAKAELLRVMSHHLAAPDPATGEVWTRQFLQRLLDLPTDEITYGHVMVVNRWNDRIGCGSEIRRVADHLGVVRERPGAPPIVARLRSFYQRIAGFPIKNPLTPEQCKTVYARYRPIYHDLANGLPMEERIMRLLTAVLLQPTPSDGIGAHRWLVLSRWSDQPDFDSTLRAVIAWVEL